MSKIIVSGSIAYDRIMDYPGLFGDQILPERVHNINISFLIDKLSVEFGGTAGNIAYNLALLGERPEIICTVGSDFGTYEKHLHARGIDTTSLAVAADTTTSSAYIFTDKGDNQIAAFHPGAGGRAYPSPVELAGKEFAIVTPSCVEDMLTLPEHYRKNNFPYFFDPGQQTAALTGEQLKSGITGAQILFANDYELALVVQKTGWDEEELLKNVTTLVTTLGEKGTRIRTKGATTEVPAVHVDKAIDPTGAGDAYRAGFMRGLLAGFSHEQCAKLGSAVAAYAVESYGTQNHKFTMDDLKVRYQKSYGEALVL